MAHFAQLDETNKVINVIVVANENCLDSDGNESEQIGIEYCKSIFGESTRWVQTSFNSNIRGKYAGIDDYYDENNDEFYTIPDAETLKEIDQTL